ncbi:hypothetical protein D3C87_1761350 [compost metagenome]
MQEVVVVTAQKLGFGNAQLLDIICNARHIRGAVDDCITSVDTSVKLIPGRSEVIHRRVQLPVIEMETLIATIGAGCINISAILAHGKALLGCIVKAQR